MLTKLLNITGIISRFFFCIELFYLFRLLGNILFIQVSITTRLVASTPSQYGHQLRLRAYVVIWVLL